MQRSAATFVLLGAFLLMVTLAGLASSLFVELPNDQAGSTEDFVSARTPVIAARIPSNGMDSQAATVADSGAHALDAVLEYARQLKRDMERDIKDYTATLVKRERVNGSLGNETRMFLKVRNQRSAADGLVPLSAYIKFDAPRATRGREVIWVAGQNDNRLISHEAGLLNLKRFQLEPTGMLAMLGNKYPITEIGLLRLVEKLIEKGERDRALGPCIVQTIENERVGDRECRLFQIVHPQSRDGFDFHIAQIFVDVERKLPLRYAAFMWPGQPGEEPPLEEEYTYLDVQLNVGLSQIDFDPENPDYNFP